jgi:hypothetical protein
MSSTIDIMSSRCILLTPPMFVVSSTRIGKQLVACTCFFAGIEIIRFGG